MKYRKTYKGEKKKVEFILTAEDFTYVNLELKTTVLNVQYKILIDKLECDLEY